MNHISRTSAFISILLITSLSNFAYSENAKIDPRLGGFLSSVINDQEALNSEKEVYANNNVSFEQFIIVVFTSKIKLDDTPDNSQALAQLGGYLEKERPHLSPKLLDPLESFNAKNETIMRTMILATIKGIIDEQKNYSNK